MRWRLVIVVAVLGGSASCADVGARATAASAAGRDQRPIINGSVDTYHDAVVQVQGVGFTCSGTIVARDAASAYVLTAATCVTPNAPVTVVQGDDVAAADAIRYPVVDFAAHPNFSGGGSAYDFAMVRLVGAGAATPVIAAASPPDGLTVGTSLRNIGYGLTSYPSGATNERHETINVIDALDAVEMSFPVPASGPCVGDQGGPSLALSNPEVVAGVISRGEAGCVGTATSGRVAQVYGSFIAPYITDAPALTCTQCTTGATNALGACMAEVTACRADATCTALRSCSDLCAHDDVDCRETCAGQHPDGVALYRAVVLCVCREACGTECSADLWCTSRQGDPCASGGQCGSLSCVDSVCCDSPCTGDCESCDLGPTTRGTCTAAVAGTDPRGRCVAASGGNPSCAGSCMASGACAFPGIEVTCGPCTACDGTGRCAAPGCEDGGAAQDDAGAAQDDAGAAQDDAGAAQDDAAAAQDDAAAAQDDAATAQVDGGPGQADGGPASGDASVARDASSGGDAAQAPDNGGGCSCRLDERAPASTVAVGAYFALLLASAARRGPRLRRDHCRRRPRGGGLPLLVRGRTPSGL